MTIEMNIDKELTMKRIAALAALVVGLALVPVQLAHGAPPGCENHDGTDADRTTHFNDGTEASYDAKEVPSGLLGLETSYEGGVMTVSAELANTCRNGDYRFVVWADSARATHLGTSASYIATGDEGSSGEPYLHVFSVTVAESHTSNCVHVEGLGTLRKTTFETTDLAELCDTGTSGGRTMF